MPGGHIAIKSVRRIEAAEIEVAQAVTINVAGSHTGAIQEDLIGEGTFLGQRVGEVNPNTGGVEFREAGFSTRLNGQCGAAIAWLFYPAQNSGRRQEKTTRQKTNPDDRRTDSRCTI